MRFDNSRKTNAELQILPISKPGITKEKKRDLQFFCPLLMLGNRDWLLAVTMTEENNLESNDLMSDEPEMDE